MQPIEFKCHSCDKKLKTSDETILGKEIRCPNCGAGVPVPPPVEEDAASLLMEEEPELESEPEAPTAILTAEEVGSMEKELDALVAESGSGHQALTATDDHENTELLLADDGQSQSNSKDKALAGSGDDSSNTELDILDKKD